MNFGSLILVHKCVCVRACVHVCVHVCACVSYIHHVLVATYIIAVEYSVPVAH